MHVKVYHEIVPRIIQLIVGNNAFLPGDNATSRSTILSRSCVISFRSRRSLVTSMGTAWLPAALVFVVVEEDTEEEDGEGDAEEGEVADTVLVVTTEPNTGSDLTVVLGVPLGGVRPSDMSSGMAKIKTM